MENKLNDKIRGCLIGYALGDALGKGTEFMTKEMVKMRYPNGLRTFGGIVRDGHRSQWKSNEWTNDTEVVLRMAEAMVAKKDLDVQDQAEMLKHWYEETHYDVVPVMRWVLSQHDYLNNPLATARRVWNQMPTLEASNEALGRAMLAGMWPTDDINKIATDVCCLTHCDQRCVSSGCVIATVAHDLLWNDCDTPFEKLEEICHATDERTYSFLVTARDGKLEDFDLDDEETLWYTRKSMGCALHALWHCDTMEEALYKLVDEGGDADTNAALALGLMGLKLGASALPEYLTEELLHRERVEEAADRLSELLKARRSA